MSDFVANAGNVLLVVLGISLLIFVHEAGHFLAARLFKVRVEVFSLGFGPRIFGTRRGETDYRISAIPLGGYVKMAGEYGDYMEDAERVPAEDDLNSKPIWQRFVIFAAGPAVNFVLAFVLFPLGFAMGAPFVAPVVGDVVEGGAAWEAGLRHGDEILSINDNRVYGFTDVALEIALSDPDDTRLVLRRDGREFEQRIELQRDFEDSRYDLGILRSQLRDLHVLDGGAARKSGLREGDVLTGAEHLRVGELHDGELVTLWTVFGLLQERRDATEVHVTRDGRPLTFVVEPKPVELEDPVPQLGARAVTTRVDGRRGAADEPGFPLREGDVVTAVGARPVHTHVELRDALRDAGPTRPVEVTLRRGEDEAVVHLDDRAVAAVLGRDVAFTADIDGPLHVIPAPGGPLAQAGLRDGDLLIALNGKKIPNFRALYEEVFDHPERVDYRVDYRRDGRDLRADIRARPQPPADFGFQPTAHQIVYDFGFLESLRAGFDQSVNTVRQTGLTLAKLFTGEVGTENLGGPLAISYITYEAAKAGFAKVLMILAMLSVNLGFINILPVPVLDGGQIMFLLFEKAKGSRLSERFMQNAQLAGFVAIVLLMVYVTVNDVFRFT